VERWHVVRLADLARERRTLVEADGREIAVFQGEGGIYAVDNTCPHAGNPLIEGDVLGRTLECVYHGWRFDLETGACLRGDEPVRRYPVEVRGGEVWIRLS
jgi:nitrite reductase/ring-hydroxylating ferredoxin subunit